MKFDVARSETTVLQVLPFNSEKKRGGVALKRVVTFVLILLGYVFGDGEVKLLISLVVNL